MGTIDLLTLISGLHTFTVIKNTKLYIWCNKEDSYTCQGTNQLGDFDKVTASKSMSYISSLAFPPRLERNEHRHSLSVDAETRPRPTLARGASLRESTQRPVSAIEPRSVRTDLDIPMGESRISHICIVLLMLHCPC